LRIKEQGIHLTLNEHNDDDGYRIYIYIYIILYTMDCFTKKPVMLILLLLLLLLLLL